MKITDKNEVFIFAMLPHYSKLLLSSKAILPVIIIDGTFQCSAYGGTLIIAMIVSSNRTNIPIAWSWSPSENEESIIMLLNLIKNVNEHIETIISDEGQALKAAISKVFPNAVHKLCAWHIAKGIKNEQMKKMFWMLIRSDHPVIFQSIIKKIFEMFGDAPSILSNGRIEMFSRYFEGIKSNDIITSSPCESINAEIRHLKTEIPMKVFHHLEVIGYNRCLDLLNLKTDVTPYYIKRKAHLEIKAQRLQILKNESFGTSRTIVDPLYPINGIRWEVNTRDYHCDCGKYRDRGFPCAHMVKAFQDMNEPYDQCIHECYRTSTIQSALQNLHPPVQLTVFEKDEMLQCPPANNRPCRVKRYLFGFERSKNKD